MKPKNTESIEQYRFEKWKTYLWVLVISSIFSIVTTLEFTDLIFKVGYKTQTFRTFILLPNLLLIMAWMFWILIFGINIYRFGISYTTYDVDDYLYVQRKFSRYYRYFDIVIASFFITFLFAVFTTLLYILR